MAWLDGENAVSACRVGFECGGDSGADAAHARVWPCVLLGDLPSWGDAGLDFSKSRQFNEHVFENLGDIIVTGFRLRLTGKTNLADKKSKCEQ